MIEGHKQHDLIGALISAIGEPDFPLRLDGLCAHSAPFDLSAIFAYPHEGNPVLLADGFGSFGNRAALEKYLRGTYLLDAVYQACVDRRPEGLYRMNELAPDEFFASDYSNSHDVHPCISLNSGALSEEIVFLARISPQTMVAYSIMRANRQPRFADAEFDNLKELSAIILSSIRKNWHGLAITQDQTGKASWSKRGELMERGFETFAHDMLSPRERMLVRLILQGHSVLSISSTLLIAEGTVKNHKKNIYAKLGISSQSELFSLFVSHIGR